MDKWALHIAVLKRDYPILQRYAKDPKLGKGVNTRDAFGRTALHIACTIDDQVACRLIVQIKGCNVNLQDYESGWTALHRCLYFGHLETALFLIHECDASTSLKDHEGLRPFELLYLCLPASTVNVLTLAHRYGTCLTMGKNVNYVLGHGDHGDRLRADRVVLHRSDAFQLSALKHNASSVVKIHMNKYHSAVIVDDAVDNLMLCGIGANGRLGNGNEETVMTFQCVHHIDSKVVDVACGYDHTIAVTAKGTVWSFGSNQYGQLGIQDTTSLYPQWVQGVLKREEVVGSAAGRYHSAVFTRFHVFTFGRNIGQLGYETGNAECQFTPRKVTCLPDGQVVQVVVGERFTASLLENGDVFLLIDYCRIKVHIPPTRFTKDVSVHRPSTFVACCVTRMFSDTKDTLGCITNWGDVYLYNLPSTETFERSSKLQSKRVWVAKAQCDAAIDAAIGHVGSLLICTRSGRVFTGSSASTAKPYKFDVLKSVQLASAVAAGSSGSFAILQREWATSAPLEQAHHLHQDISALWHNPTLCDYRLSMDYGVVQVHGALLAARLPSFARIFDHGRFSDLRSGSVAIGPVNSKNMPSVCIRGCKLSKMKNVLSFVYTGEFTQRNVESSMVCDVLELFGLGHMQAVYRSAYMDATDTLCHDMQGLLNTGKAADVTLQLSDKQLSVHRVILAARSPFFAALLREGSPWLVGRRELNVDMRHTSSHVMQHILNWIYSDVGRSTFLPIVTHNKEEFTKFIVQVLACADELLVDDFNLVCQSLLIELLSKKNVYGLLETADRHSCDQLKQACLGFLCAHADMLVDSGPKDLLPLVEHTVQQEMKEMAPFVRSGETFALNEGCAVEYEKLKAKTPVKVSVVTKPTWTVPYTTFMYLTLCRKAPVVTASVSMATSPPSMSFMAKPTPKPQEPTNLVHLTISPQKKGSQKERKKRQQKASPASKPQWSSPSASGSSFSRIQQQQQEERDALARIRNQKKSLLDIQTEELVIQGWKEYYAALGQDWEPDWDTFQ